LGFHVSTAEMGLVGQETEVTAKPRRRQFTAEFKRKVLAEADACTKVGAPRTEFTLAACSEGLPPCSRPVANG